MGVCLCALSKRSTCVHLQPPTQRAPPREQGDRRHQRHMPMGFSSHEYITTSSCCYFVAIDSAARKVVTSVLNREKRANLHSNGHSIDKNARIKTAPHYSPQIRAQSRSISLGKHYLFSMHLRQAKTTLARRLITDKSTRTARMLIPALAQPKKKKNRGQTHAAAKGA